MGMLCADEEAPSTGVTAKLSMGTLKDFIVGHIVELSLAAAACARMERKSTSVFISISRLGGKCVLRKAFK